MGATERTVRREDCFLSTVKIATDTSLVPGKGWPIWLLAPLLDPNLRNADLTKNWQIIFRDYILSAHTLFALAPLEDCDVALIPSDWSFYQGGFHWLARPDRAAIRRAKEFATRAAELGKPVAVFFSGERSHEPVPLPGCQVFRKSVYGSRMASSDSVIPEVTYLDPLRELGAEQPPVRQWSQKPTVGFCGFARPSTLTETFKGLAYQVNRLLTQGKLEESLHYGLAVRHRALGVLQESERVSCAFTTRDSAVMSPKKRAAAPETNPNRTEFLENMVNSDYQLSIRGSANYSKRPWEALSMGRIPVHVLTDAPLPFSNEIDWPQFSVTVDVSEIERLPEAISDFHASLQGHAFADRQLECRDLWEQFFSPLGFARHWKEDIRRRMARNGRD